MKKKMNLFPRTSTTKTISLLLQLQAVKLETFCSKHIIADCSKKFTHNKVNLAH